MAWSQLGYKLYCFKQWYSPLTEACITQFQWLWVKYILIKMCKKWYPTEGLAVRLSKFFNINKSPHFFHVSHFLSPISPHYKPHSPHFFRIISMFSLHFFQLRIFSAFVMRRSAKNCGENAELRKGCGDPRYGPFWLPGGTFMFLYWFLSRRQSKRFEHVITFETS